ncbi:hypothetical protein [Leptospira bandrabouensis]|uniref:hypothetical protein n=1 Tax=Leptospira bandrabouensis TaxID=2484903 RepID=UPI001EE91DD4|nr:hypothetical protein [Leptospira bandrabouensis]MCG6146510.1 hypothetical protein [Leptospira bandrabouensis]MCG6161882.1 hypothetical protein [Leptospira bandrabouensis]MCG6166067.1 hypothetical protein [Leptospira bandrabouensis]
MSDFKKFITDFKKNNKNLLLTESEKNSNLLMIKSDLSSIANIAENEKDQFAHEIVSFATSDEFIDILDSKLPPPLPGEDKETFMKRGRQMIRRLLLEKME